LAAEVVEVKESVVEEVAEVIEHQAKLLDLEWLSQLQ
tara:strand:+ start:16 stop:126 length:111 start_codon:yes stop_codon:yes gene_type:complete